MSKDIDFLKRLINTKAIKELRAGRYSGQAVTLNEPKEPESHVEIDGIPENTIVFNLDDYFDPPERIFSGDKGECCRSDYILISEQDNYKVIVCAELKRGTDELSHIKNQLRGANAFIDYIKAALREFYDYDFKAEEYERHYVAFQNTAKRRGTRLNSEDAKPNTTIDSLLKLEGGISFRFKKIIQKK